MAASCTVSVSKANAVSINEKCVLDSTESYELEEGLMLFTEERSCDLYNVDGLCYHGPVDMTSFYANS